MAAQPSASLVIIPGANARMIACACRRFSINCANCAGVYRDERGQTVASVAISSMAFARYAAPLRRLFTWAVRTYASFEIRNRIISTVGTITARCSHGSTLTLYTPHNCSSRPHGGTTAQLRQARNFPCSVNRATRNECSAIAFSERGVG